MNEFELIKRYFQAPSGRSKVSIDSNAAASTELELGIGDDCAVIRFSPRYFSQDKSPLKKPEELLASGGVESFSRLAISVDTLVEGVHFPQGAKSSDLAYRALVVALSDLAAMGAEPRWFTLSLTLPEVDESWLAGFSEGLFSAAKHYSCELIGGDTTRGALTIAVQVIGELDNDDAFRRDAAKIGDSIFVTGSLGKGAAALAFIEEHLDSTENADYFTQAFYRPIARFVESRLLKGKIFCAIDISDGLLADLRHICDASQVGAEVEIEKLPIGNEVCSVAEQSQREVWALSGGDDYELCFTVRSQYVDDVRKMIADQQLIATEIGKVVAGDGVVCKKNGEPIQLSEKGYQHF